MKSKVVSRYCRITSMLKNNATFTQSKEHFLIDRNEVSYRKKQGKLALVMLRQQCFMRKSLNHGGPSWWEYAYESPSDRATIAWEIARVTHQKAGKIWKKSGQRWTNFAHVPEYIKIASLKDRGRTSRLFETGNTLSPSPLQSSKWEGEAKRRQISVAWRREKGRGRLCRASYDIPPPLPCGVITLESTDTADRDREGMENGGDRREREVLQWIGLEISHETNTMWDK